jgi:TRAP-type C4-dicarboxylate transport system substrate-binding protein
MKKKQHLRLLGSLLLVLVILISTSVTVHAQQPIKYRFYFHSSPTGGHAYFFLNWIKQVKEATQGRLDIVFYPGATLGKPTEAYQMVRSGVVELAVVIIGFFPGQFPLSDVIQLPFIDLHSGRVASRVYWGLYEKFPQFRAEYPGVKPLALYCDTPTPIGVNRPVRTMEDMKGLKIRALTGSPTEFLKTFGGVPVLMPPGDIYTSMERKVLDGWMISWEACVGHKLFEVTDYFTAANTYQPALAFLMNPAAWDKLPPDIKKILEKYIGAAGSDFCGREFDLTNAKDKEKVRATKGKTIIDLSPAETKRWKETCRPIWDKWVANMEAKGLPGKAVLQETLNLSAKFQAEFKK